MCIYTLKKQKFLKVVKFKNSSSHVAYRLNIVSFSIGNSIYDQVQIIFKNIFKILKNILKISFETFFCILKIFLKIIFTWS